MAGCRGINSAARSVFVCCCFAHCVRSAPVRATDWAVRVKSTAMISSQPVNFDLKTCVSVPSWTRDMSACSGRSIMVNSSCESLIAAARTRRVDFLPNQTNRSR
uniref:Putative secreted protein n=1 Tax=Anopheles marajoara TaxID=58244 RepID=A0A2M4C8C7_9DIPT